MSLRDGTLQIVATSGAVISYRVA
jgi:hypothetical protein